MTRDFYAWPPSRMDNEELADYLLRILKNPHYYIGEAAMEAVREAAGRLREYAKKKENQDLQDLEDLEIEAATG